MTTEKRSDSTRTDEARGEAIRLRARRNHQRSMGWRV